MNFKQRSHSSSNCSHPYCLSQSIGHLPDIPIKEGSVNFNCETPSLNLSKRGIIDRHYTKALELDLLKELKANTSVIFNLIIDTTNINIFLLSEISTFNNFHITIHINDARQSFEYEKKLEDYSERLYFFFPIKNTGATPIDIENFKAKYPKLNIRPVITGLIFNFEWSDFKDRNPVPKVEIKNQRLASSVKPLISIVIPVFDHAEELRLTLNQISLQTLDKNKYEVIIVEDGSNDSAQTVVQKFINSFPQINLSYTYLSRPSPRDMGDNCWRSMVARNFGASISQSEILLFLDSDILLGIDFLDKLISTHKSYDIIQACRYHLTKEATAHITLRPELFNNEFKLLRKKTRTRSNNYFEEFQKKVNSWRDIEHGWRYASTFCFSVKKELFNIYGGFSKSYCFYGFDDVELGYRMFKGGERFHLMKENVYALYHEEKRSEYMNDLKKKKELLTLSAKLFYFQNLGRDIFEALKPYYEDE